MIGARKIAAESVRAVLSQEAPGIDVQSLVTVEDAWLALEAALSTAAEMTQLPPDRGDRLHIEQRCRPELAPELSPEQFVWALGLAVGTLAGVAKQRLERRGG